MEYDTTAEEWRVGPAPLKSPKIRYSTSTHSANSNLMDDVEARKGITKMEKYDFTGETITIEGSRPHTLHRIRRLKDGLVGGWIEHKRNLSHIGDCFVYDDAKVFGDGSVFGNATVHSNAVVSESASVYGEAKVFGNATISGLAKVYDSAKVYGNAQVCGDAEVFDRASVYGHAIVRGNCSIFERAEVYGNTIVIDDALILGWVHVSDALVIGHSRIMRDTDLSYSQLLRERFEKVFFHTFSNPRCREITVLVKNGKPYFNIGCQQLITKEKFIERIHGTDGGLYRNPHRREYLRVLETYEGEDDACALVETENSLPIDFYNEF